jgi:glucose-6-phosphate isomerase
MTDARETAWRSVETAATALHQRSLRDLFAADANRAAAFTASACGLTLDLSRQRIDAALMAAFSALAGAADLGARLAAMRDGARVNTTEDRAALHVALRGSGGDAAVRAQVAQTRTAVRTFAADVAGRQIDAVVHIGIGGSDLGPRLVLDALKPWRRKGLDVRFAANVDGAEIVDALDGLDPARTLIVVVSKTFTTQETLANAEVARAWLGDRPGQIVAVTAAPDKAKAWGAGTVFPFWDWVGGRYSLWSAVGLTCEIALAPGAFDALLDGAHAMDEHTFSAPLADTLPFRAACVQAANSLAYASTATIPYARRLALLPAWLQQLEMESNGKGVDVDGHTLARRSATLTWGEPGTNAQHSFFQLLHQGRDVIPVEFVVVAESEGPASHRAMTLANALAQAQALYEGKTAEAAKAEMRAAGMDEAHAAALAPHRAFSGDRPSTMLALDDLSPKTLGALLAFYEHRTVIQAWLFGINPFDQWGVELGKQMAGALLPALSGAGGGTFDPATAAWVARLKR